MARVLDEVRTPSLFDSRKFVLVRAAETLLAAASSSEGGAALVDCVKHPVAGTVLVLELEKLAGYPESANVRSELDRLLERRAVQFSKEAPARGSAPGYEGDAQLYTLNISRNFMYLVPELADYLHDHACDKVKEAVDEYTRIAPCWFVAKYDATFSQGILQVLFD